MPKITLSEYRVSDYTGRKETRQVGLRAGPSLEAPRRRGRRSR